MKHDIQKKFVWEVDAFTSSEIRSAVEHCLNVLSYRLPSRHSLIMIKPNASFLRLGMSGAMTDFRVIVAWIEALQDRGYYHIGIGDSSHFSYKKSKQPFFTRVNLDKIISRYGLRFIDLDQAQGENIAFFGNKISIPNLIKEAGLILNLPSVYTDVKQGLSIGLNNLLGFLRQKDRLFLYQLGESAIIEFLSFFPEMITFVDSIVVTEGEDPIRGNPINVGLLFWSEHILLQDLLVSRRFGYTPEEVPYLWHALRKGVLSLESQITIESTISAQKTIKRPLAYSPAQTTLDFINGYIRSYIQKRAFSQKWKSIAKIAHLQIPNQAKEEAIPELIREPNNCANCHKCETVCPANLLREEIGKIPLKNEKCINCLYCLQICPNHALSLSPKLGPDKVTINKIGPMTERLLKDKTLSINWNL